jgi:hypothetical protein
MVCRSCGLDNDPYANFCARCNATLVEPAKPQFDQMPPPPPPSPGPFPPARRSPLMLAVLAAGVILLIGVIAAGVLFVRSGKPAAQIAATVPIKVSPTLPAIAATTAPPAGSPHDQAAVLDKLLNRSAASRSKLNAAIDKVSRCTQLNAALADMRKVGDERTQQLAAVAAADVSGLAGGETLRSTFKAALTNALAADQAFVAWAEPAAAGSCANTSARQAAWNRGQAASKKAQAAKKQFVAAWNPVAVPLGFDSRTTQYI